MARHAADFATKPQPIAYVDTIEQPPGPFAFAVSEDGALLWLQFLDGEYSRTIEDELTKAGFLPATDPERTAQARRELLEYCRGERTTFTLPLALKGTDWQVSVWQALMRIPFGETRTYGQIAAELGRPHAARAMGRANATNHIPLVVPCHRVIGANGALTGFEGGLHIKSRLLEHEARVRQA
jgi:methylated-DNA-[protein]-cysteine S-methyltransferase